MLLAELTGEEREDRSCDDRVDKAGNAEAPLTLHHTVWSNEKDLWLRNCLSVLRLAVSTCDGGR